MPAAQQGTLREGTAPQLAAILRLGRAGSQNVALERNSCIWSGSGSPFKKGSIGCTAVPAVDMACTCAALAEPYCMYRLAAAVAA